MPRVFVSYRRQDAAYVVAILSERLQKRFGPESVFLDVDSIPLGVDFREHIGKAVSQCDVLLAVIGDQWLDVRNQRGERRLDDPADYARIEIETALKRGIPTIPVLVESATMPPADALPESLHPLVFRNAAELRAGKDLYTHVDRLIEGLAALFPTESPVTPSSAAASATTPASSTPVITAPAAPARAREVSAITVDDIRTALGAFADKQIFLAPQIPLSKVANAIEAYAPGLKPDEVLLLYDNTVWGGSRDGLLLTAHEVWWHNMTEAPSRRRFDAIETISIEHFRLVSHIRIDGGAIHINVGQHRLIAQAIGAMVAKFAGVALTA